VRATFIPQTRGENSLREHRSYLLLIVRYSPLFTLLRREKGEEGDGRREKVRTRERAEATGCNRDNRGEGAHGGVLNAHVRKESGVNAKANPI